MTYYLIQFSIISILAMSWLIIQDSPTPGGLDLANQITISFQDPILVSNFSEVLFYLFSLFPLYLSAIFIKTSHLFKNI